MACYTPTLIHQTTNTYKYKYTFTCTYTKKDWCECMYTVIFKSYVLYLLSMSGVDGMFGKSILKFKIFYCSIDGELKCCLFFFYWEGLSLEELEDNFIWSRVSKMLEREKVEILYLLVKSIVSVLKGLIDSLSSTCPTVCAARFPTQQWQCCRHKLWRHCQSVLASSRVSWLQDSREVVRPIVRVRGPFLLLNVILHNLISFAGIPSSDIATKTRSLKGLSKTAL